MTRVYRSIGSITLAWLIGSCGGGDSIVGPPPPTVATVTISSDAATLVPAGTVQLSAVAKDVSGQILQRTFAWNSSDPAKATVSASGAVVGIAPGLATITAAADGKSATSTVTVLEGGILSTNGGILTLEAGAVQLDVPPDALNAAAALSVVASNAFDSDPRVVKGTPFEFGPTGLTFAKPVSVRIKYAAANLPSGTEEAALEIYLRTNSGWQAIDGAKADIEAKVVSVAVSHFSTYAILLPDAVVGIAVAGPPERSMSSLVVGDSVQLTATLTAGDGRILSHRIVTWATSDATVASVSSTGVITALKQGPVTISASAGGKTGTVVITVSAVPVAEVIVSPASASVVSGSTQQLTAVMRDAANKVLTGRVVTWSSSDDAIATVDANGLVTAHAAGTATITAASEGVNGTAHVTVVPVPVATVTVSGPTTPMTVGGTQQLIATTRDANGVVLTDRNVAWASSNTAVLTVTASGNPATVTAVGGGNATITATSETVVGTTSIAVTAPVVTVIVNPPSLTISVGLDHQLTTTLKDFNNNILSGRSVVWSSSDPAVATVSAAGLVTGVAAGPAVITATSEGKNGTSSITVSPIPVASVSVSPSATTIQVGQTIEATATTFDASNIVLTGRAITWSTADATVATVSPSGAVTGIAVGSTTITATSEGKSATASIMVIPIPVASVVVSLSPSSITAVGTSQATATTLDAQGGVLTGRAVGWASDNNAVATVNSSTGLVTAVTIGTANIVATSEGQSGTALLKVTAAPVATITVSKPATPMVLGGTQQLTAVMNDAKGGILTDRAITWTSSKPAVLTVTGNATPATVTAVGVGSATITATSETVTSAPTPAITVNQAPVSTVTLSAPVTPMLLGSSQTLTAIPKDANGNPLVDRTVRWISSNSSAVAVNSLSSVSTSSGATMEVTAIGTGTASITATSESVSSSPTPSITVNQGVAAGPLRVSTVNPRYFADGSGKIVYLTGSEYWKTLEDNGLSNPPPAFDYSAFLDFLQRHNHNFTRMFTWEQARWSSLTSVDHYFAPNIYVRSGPGLAIDSGPKFDLNQINPAYLARVRQRVIDAGARGIYVSIQLFNGWSVEMKPGATANNPWLSHPFNAANNINGIDGDPNGDQSGSETETLSDTSITALQETYVKAVIDAVNDLDNVIYEIANETDQPADAWQYHMIRVIRDYEAMKPKQHPIGMTVPYPGGSDSDVLNSEADWVARAGNVNDPVVADGFKVSMNDTDHLCGICGDPTWPWKSFTRGHNPLMMDGYDGSPGYQDPAYNNPGDPKWEAIRTNMGYARSYAVRMDLAHALPHGELASSGYCLAVVDNEYLVFLPSGGSVGVDLSGLSGSRTVEWFNPTTGQRVPGGTVAGGGGVVLTAPFVGMAAVYIHP